jgi:hypothetical protein
MVQPVAYAANLTWLDVQNDVCKQGALAPSAKVAEGAARNASAEAVVCAHLFKRRR